MNPLPPALVFANRTGSERRNRVALLTATLLVGIAVEVPAQAPPPGAQFQVNSYTTGGQYTPVVAVDDSGDFVVAWQSHGSSGTDTSGSSIQAQRFDASGTPQGVQFQVNTYTTGGQFQPAVAVGAAGNFVIAWSGYGSNGTDTSYTSVHAQRFDALGVPQGGEFQVNSYTSFMQSIPAVEVDANGNFVVAWMSYGSNGTDVSLGSVQARRFDATGASLGEQFQVNTLTTGWQTGPALAMGDSGDFIVVWQDPGIQARRYAGSGDPLGLEFQINSYTTGGSVRPDVARASTGDFVVVWMSDGSSGSDSSEESVQGRFFEASGVPDGDQFQVNTYTTGRQGYPDVAINGAGDFLVAWQSIGSSGSDNSDRSIQARPFARNGAALSREFQVNSLTTSHQLSPTVALDGQGNVVLFWSSAVSGGTDNSLSSIQALRYGWIYSDGFESGDADRWSLTEP